MTIIAYKLSMPSNNSWNGKWTGQNNFYCVVENLGKTQKAERRAKELISSAPYGYDFGDGWFASIDVEEIDAQKARAYRKKSSGFCGYDWMIQSIKFNGCIKI